MDYRSKRSDHKPLLSAANKVNHLHFGQEHKNIFGNQVQPVMVLVNPNGDGFFQQDNAPCHRAHIIHKSQIKINGGPDK